MNDVTTPTQEPAPAAGDIRLTIPDLVSERRRSALAQILPVWRNKVALEPTATGRAELRRKWDELCTVPGAA